MVGDESIVDVVFAVFSGAFWSADSINLPHLVCLIIAYLKERGRRFGVIREGDKGVRGKRYGAY